MIDDYLNQDAYRITKGNHVLYSGLTAATLVLTGSLPAVPFRVAITLSSITDHTDCAGSVVVGGETLTFTAAGKKTTTVSLSALPVITTAGLDCNILVEAITTGGAPILAETLTAIKIRLEGAQSGFYNSQGIWTKTDYIIFCSTSMGVGDIIRYNSTDYKIQKKSDNPGLDGTVEFYEYAS